jgi:peptidyl-prolyl cis-trans isomerase B (cyclophilin B)
VRLTDAAPQIHLMIDQLGREHPVAPSKTRQRALARAKLERQIARRAAQARRRRQIQAAVGAGLVVVLVVVGIAWATGAFKSTKTTPAADDCAWTTIPKSDKVKDVGKPPTKNIVKSGAVTMTITTNVGVIEADLDRAGAPCTVASFGYLAGKQFFNNTKCHRLTTSGIYVLQCGDPSATGSGGPAYKFPDEKLPTPADQPSADPSANPSASPSAGTSTNLYPAGTLAMANSGADTNGSQFFIVYKDGSSLEAKYTVFGKVTKGLDLVQKVAAAGVTPGSSDTDGAPKTEVTIQSLMVAAGSGSASASPAPSGSAGSS